MRGGAGGWGVSGISLSCDSADLSGSIEASRRKAFSSVAQGVWGREVWTAATLLLLWNENLGDLVQPQDKASGGEQGRGREKLVLVTSLGPSIKPLPKKDRLVSRLFHYEANKSSLLFKAVWDGSSVTYNIKSLTDRLPFTETNWVCLYPSQPEIA